MKNLVLSSFLISNNDILLPWLWAFIVLSIILVSIVLFLSYRVDFWKIKYLKLKKEIEKNNTTITTPYNSNKKYNIKLAFIIIVFIIAILIN